MLSYVGPESVAPIASAIAAFFGFLLLFWRKVIRTCKRTFRFIFRIKVEEEDDLDVDSTAPDDNTGVNGAALPADEAKKQASVPQDQAS